MKRIISKLAVLLLAGAALIATGCSKAKNEDGKDGQDESEYITRAEFNEYKKETAATVKTMVDAINELSALTAGFPEGKTIKQYIDSK